MGYKEKVFYSKGREALAHVAQRGGGCFIPGDTQGQAGQGSEYLMELWVSLFTAGELDWMAFKGPFQFRRPYYSLITLSKKRLLLFVQQ